jgi:Rha family phage regulatory protein
MSEQLVYLSKKSTPITDSRKVAEKFGKKHFHVLRNIENLKAQLSENEHETKFGFMFCKAEMSVTVGNGATRKDSFYVMTQDGFTLLTMGFTGSKAMQFKLQYIGEFNRMKAELKKARLSASVFLSE